MLVNDPQLNLLLMNFIIFVLCIIAVYFKEQHEAVYELIAVGLKLASKHPDKTIFIKTDKALIIKALFLIKKVSPDIYNLLIKKYLKQFRYGSTYKHEPYLEYKIRAKKISPTVGISYSEEKIHPTLGINYDINKNIGFDIFWETDNKQIKMGFSKRF